MCFLNRLAAPGMVWLLSKDANRWAVVWIGESADQASSLSTPGPVSARGTLWPSGSDSWPHRQHNAACGATGCAFKY